jgi:hypothetical protein
MYRITVFSMVLAALAVSGCGGRDNGGSGGGSGGNHGGGSGGSAGNGGGTAGSGGSGGGGSAGSGGSGGSAGSTGDGGCMSVSVNDAVSNLALYSGNCVNVTGAVVVAAAKPYAGTSGCVGNMQVETFYIQDRAGSQGVGVFKSCKDDVTPLPNVGDVVSVSGRLAKFDSSLQISSSTKYGIALTLSLDAVDAGRVPAGHGAVPPAGTPIEISTANGAQYAHTLNDPHPEQVGEVLHFSGVTVTDRYPPNFIVSKADGGTPTTRGFELNNGVWVDDSIVYYDCIRTLPVDGGIPLPNGVRGVWDRYNDFYGSVRDPDSGVYTPAPTVPVLVPLTCADLQ